MGKKQIKEMILGVWDRIEQANAISVEKKKYKDPRRVQRVESVSLTKEQLKRIDDLYSKNYGKKISVQWHKSYTSYTGTFDEKYLPETLYIPRFERYMNYDSNLANVLENKNLLYVFANAAGVVMPKRYLACQEGFYSTGDGRPVTIDEAAELLMNIGDCFAKPSIGTDSGRGCEVFCFKNGKDVNTGISCKEALVSMGKNFTIQERVICHESVRRIYSGSVNTFRIMTYRWHDDIIVAPIIMRIGRGGSYLDNAHAGGMFIALSNDGTLHKRAFTELEDSYEVHPDSNLKFEGYKIELLPEVVETVVRMHKTLPTVGVINWDMTINEAGTPILIEANVNGGGIWIFQMAHGKGVFEERTEEILRWIGKMDHLKYAIRKKHHFGD